MSTRCVLWLSVETSTSPNSYMQATSEEEAVGTDNTYWASWGKEVEMMVVIASHYTVMEKSDSD